MNILLFDHPKIRRSLLPLTFTRPVAGLRVGIMTIIEKWRHDLQQNVHFLTEPYLAKKYPPTSEDDTVYVNGALCPDDQLLAAIGRLGMGESLMAGEVLLAARGGAMQSVAELMKQNFKGQTYTQKPVLLKHTWELFLANGDQIRADFKRLVGNRTSQPLNDPFTMVYGKENLFIEPGVSIKAAIINAESGPVYLGENSEVQEGTIIQGPFAMCEQSQLRLGGKMRPNTTIGPWCKVGGEVGNVIFQSHSNKAHEGFFGNSVVGAWCNLGADTNNSNLKNNYSEVKVWDYYSETSVETGQQFCGTIIGDHSKCSINTMLNTGTVIGVCANIFGGGFPPKFVPSWSWGATVDNRIHDFEKSCDTISRVMGRRSLILDDVERDILQDVFRQTEKYRQSALHY